MTQKWASQSYQKYVYFLFIDKHMRLKQGLRCRFGFEDFFHVIEIFYIQKEPREAGEAPKFNSKFVLPTLAF